MYLRIGEAANLLGVSTSTVRLWEALGKIRSSFRTKGGHRRFLYKEIAAEINPTAQSNRKTLAYARVSCHDQKSDLERQKKLLTGYCKSISNNFELISDLGSGLNYKKRGLKSLIKMVVSGRVDKIVLTHKDRLLRFGSEIIFHLCSFFNTEIILIHEPKEQSCETQLANDVLEILTVFSARLYGKRAHKNKKNKNSKNH